MCNQHHVNSWRGLNQHYGDGKNPHVVYHAWSGGFYE
nr:MAG TPA: hypothetical protein [Caudoviricetes sp.]